MQPNLRRFFIGVLNLCFLALATNLYAQITQTREWVNFYGVARLDGQPVPVDAMVQAYAYNPEDPIHVEILCGEYTVAKEGLYGFLACYIDDPETEVDPETGKGDEGVNPGDEVRFTINDIPAGNSSVLINVENGARFEVNLDASLPKQIPEPLSVTLLGLGLAGLAGYLYHRKNV